MLLDRELADLQNHRLRVLLTQRVPAFELPIIKTCDFSDDCYAFRMIIFWVSAQITFYHENALVVELTSLVMHSMLSRSFQAFCFVL